MLTLHMMLVGAWIATVVVEALFERLLMAEGEGAWLLLARLHWQVDKWIELPLLAGVTLTGGMVLTWWIMSIGLALKLLCAAGAVLANLYCALLVYRRLEAAEDSNWVRFRKLNHRQHKWGAVVFAALLATAALGLWLG